MARRKKELTEGTTPTEVKKVKVTPFMNASRIIRHSTTMTTEHFEKLIELCFKRIEDIKESEIKKLIAEKEKIEERIKKLEGKAI